MRPIGDGRQKVDRAGQRAIAMEQHAVHVDQDRGESEGAHGGDMVNTDYQGGWLSAQLKVAYSTPGREACSASQIPPAIATRWLEHR
jgi:hypothetical protein